MSRMASPNDRFPRDMRISKSYILGWSDRPFKKRKPPPPPKPSLTEVYKEMLSTPGGLIEYVASDGRKGKLSGLPNIGLTHGPLTAKNLARVPSEKIAKKTPSTVAKTTHGAKRSKSERKRPAQSAGAGSVLGGGLMDLFGGGDGLADSSKEKADKASEDWTKDQDDELTRRKNDGESWAVIGEAMGKQKHELQARWKVIMPSGWTQPKLGKGGKKQNKGGNQNRKQGGEGSNSWDQKAEEEKKDEGTGDGAWNNTGWDSNNNNGNGDSGGNNNPWGAAWDSGGTGGDSNDKKDDKDGDKTTGWGNDEWATGNSGENKDAEESKSDKNKDSAGNWNGGGAWGGNDATGGDSTSKKGDDGNWGGGEWGKNNSGDTGNTGWNNDNDKKSTTSKKNNRDHRSQRSHDKRSRHGDGSHRKGSVSRSHRSNNRNGDDKNDKTSTASAVYQELYPDGTFSMKDLALIGKILKEDSALLWVRIASRFRDKTGRILHPNVFEEKLTGKIAKKGSWRDV